MPSLKRLPQRCTAWKLRSRSEVEQQKAGATALTNPQNTKNYVDVVSAKRTEVEKVAKTIITTETAAPRTKITNKFETNSLR